MKKNVELKTKILLKRFSCNMSRAEVILKPLTGIRVALYCMVPSVVDVTVSLTLFSPVW